ncbi:LexA family protein [Mycoplasma sp. P36-A1]|uniref:LexA family protein n=1 Tax=Mycoplasma sp. P36-A1 TaxID=3252900 RepID=UPI003C2AAE58
MIGDILKGLRKKSGLTQKELAKLLNISHQAYSKYENEVTEPNIETINILSEIFNVTTDFLLGKEKTPTITIDGVEEELIKIPVLGNIQAGNPTFAEDNIIGYEDVPASFVKGNPSEYGFLYVNGDSMNLARIYEGDKILIHKQNDVNNGDIAVVMVNGEDFTLKRVYKKDNLLILQPESSNTIHQARYFTPQEVLEKPVVIMGRLEKNIIDY